MKMITDTPKTIAHHYKKDQLNYLMIIYTGLVHVLAAKGIFRLTQCSADTLIFAFLLWPIRWEFERIFYRNRIKHELNPHFFIPHF